SRAAALTGSAEQIGNLCLEGLRRRSQTQNDAPGAEGIRSTLLSASATGAFCQNPSLRFPEQSPAQIVRSSGARVAGSALATGGTGSGPNKAAQGLPPLR